MITIDKINYDNRQIITNFAIQFKEVLVGKQIEFVATLADIGDLNENLGHFEFDAEEKVYSDGKTNIPKIGQNFDFYLGDNVKIVNGLPIL